MFLATQIPQKMTVIDTIRDIGYSEGIIQRAIDILKRQNPGTFIVKVYILKTEIKFLFFFSWRKKYLMVFWIVQENVKYRQGNKTS